MVGLFGADAATAAEFIPHRAHYKVQLVWAKSGTGIASLDGDMVALWDQTCEGWTLSQKSMLNMYDPGGRKRLSLASNVSTWESADGREYRFAVRNETNGRKTEVIEGIARLPSKGSRGWAEFTEPKKNRIALPAGTLFPTLHTIMVMGHMNKAPTTISRWVFDGLTRQGLHEVNAVIGAENRDPQALAELSGRRSWPVQLAFFTSNRAESAPEHEIGMRLFENGVGDNMTIDFGNFKVRASLARLELGQRPSCK